MRHGRFENGLRKVEVTDDLGRVTTLHLRGDVSLREAIGDIWEGSKADDSRIAIEYWKNVRSITARCGDEVEVFERTLADWIAAPADGRLV